MGKIDKIEKYVKKGKADKLAALAAISGLEKLISDEQSLNALIGMLENGDTEIKGNQHGNGSVMCRQTHSVLLYAGVWILSSSA